MHTTYEEIFLNDCHSGFCNFGLEIFIKKLPTKLASILKFKINILKVHKQKHIFFLYL